MFTHKAEAKFFYATVAPREAEINLRETKNFWVDEEGNKYKKTNGCAPEVKRGAVHNGKIYLETLRELG